MNKFKFFFLLLFLFSIKAHSSLGQETVKYCNISGEIIDEARDSLITIADPSRAGPPSHTFQVAATAKEYIPAPVMPPGARPFAPSEVTIAFNQRTGPQSVSRSLFPKNSRLPRTYNVPGPYVFRFTSHRDTVNVIFNHAPFNLRSDLAHFQNPVEFQKIINANPHAPPITLEIFDKGGFRQAYIDKSPKGKVWKNLIRGTDAEKESTMAREIITTDFVNQHFARIEAEIGMDLQVVGHDYTYAEYGWVSQEKIHGMTLDEYRKTHLHSALERESFNHILKKELVDVNVAAYHLNQRAVGDMHLTKGGEWADVDLGLVRNDAYDLDNCRVVGTKLVGTPPKTIPIIRCFDV